jgi:uncharacterized protein (DUF952 family)
MRVAGTHLRGGPEKQGYRPAAWLCIFGLVLIYKILLPAEWGAFEAAGQFDGSPSDREDGFIHLSSRDQVAETARRVFADEPALIVAEIDDGVVAETLRWENSANRGRFPHVYGPLPRAAVSAIYTVAGAAYVDDALPPEIPQADPPSATGAKPPA